MRRAIWVAAGAGLLLMLGALGWGLAHPASPAAASLVGRPAPELAIRAFDGPDVRLSDLRGRPVVINFWASWCGPCRQEDPALRQAAQRHAALVSFIGVNFQDTEAAARAYAVESASAYPLGPAIVGGARDYGVQAPPQTYFVNAAGLVAARHVGPVDAQTLERYLGLIGA